MAKSKKQPADPSAALSSRPPKRQAAQAAQAKLDGMRDADHVLGDVFYTSDAEELDDMKASQPDEGIDRDDEEDDDTPAGCKKWPTTTMLASGAPLTELAKVSNTTWQFTQTVEVHHREAFTLRPLIMTDGALKGRHILLLEPAPSTTPAFRLLDLPAEIRAIIYEYAFNETGTIEISSHKTPHQPRRPVRDTFRSLYQCGSRKRNELKWDDLRGKWLGGLPSALTILALCRSVQHEAAPIIYGKNTFKFRSTNDLEVFLKQIGGMRQHLRAVDMGRVTGADYASSKAATIFSALKPAKQFRTISFAESGVYLSTADGNYLYGRRWTRPSVEFLFSDLKPLLRKLHEAQTRGESSHSVLDLVQIVPQSKCMKCDPINGTSRYPQLPCPNCKKYHKPIVCPNWCKETVRNSAQKTKKMRRLIAEWLRIVDDTPDNDELAEASARERSVDSASSERTPLWSPP